MSVRDEGEAELVRKGHSEANISEGSDLSELKTLYSLWKAAGKSVNLWDWFEGFRASVRDSKGDEQHHDEENEDDEVGGGSRKLEWKLRASPLPCDQQEAQEEAADEETSARLHAIFIRFCEEARMLGLVRKKGQGGFRRGDEVTKGIGVA